MRSVTTSGTIIKTDEFGIDYHLCRIDYTVYGDGEYEYVFTPDYSVIDILPKDFQGIPGVDLGLRKSSYLRRNMCPVFISERTPGENREDLWDLLAEAGMDHLNRLEWLIRTDKGYVGDDLRVIRWNPGSPPFSLDVLPSDAFETCRDLLAALATGRQIIIDEKSISESDRQILSRTLRIILSSHMRSQPKQSCPSRIGRKSIPLDVCTLEKAREWIELGIKTPEQVALELGISRATLYRRLKKQ